MNILQMRNISKSFGGVKANDNIWLSVEQGEVHTLLGENGAGKSTLMSILTGLYQPDEGEIFYQGNVVKITSPKEAVKFGIGMVYQHFMLVENMTVFENMILGLSKGNSIFIQKNKMRAEIEQLAEKYGLQVEFDKLISDISVGEQQRVEILKALYRDVDLLVLDEPTAVLTDAEVAGLFEIIHKLTADKKSVIFISHKMKEVMEISDRITILRNGKSIKTVEKANTTEEELTNLMVGRKLQEQIVEKSMEQKEDVLRLEKVSFHRQNKHNGLNEISLEVKKGQIVGVAGVDGNGQSQLALLASGNLVPESGAVYVNGEKIKHFTPETFIRRKVSHIPEDRNKMGLIGDMTIAENLILKETDGECFSYGRGLYLRKDKIHAYAKEMQQGNDIRCLDMEQEVRSLSGGNQQKVILARELQSTPELLIAMHPTRGLDIGASEFVHEQMLREKKRGCGILLISANLDEIIKLADVIVVMFEGKIMGTFPGIKPPIDKISMAMTGRGETA